MNFEKILIALALLCLCASIGCFEKAHTLLPEAVDAEPEQDGTKVERNSAGTTPTETLTPGVAETPNTPLTPYVGPTITEWQILDGTAVLEYRWEITADGNTNTLHIRATEPIPGAVIEKKEHPWQVAVVGIAWREGLAVWGEPQDNGDWSNIPVLVRQNPPPEEGSFDYWHINFLVTGLAGTKPDFWINWQGEAYPLNIPDTVVMCCNAWGTVREE